MNNPTYRFIGAILAVVLLALCVMEGQVAWARINNDITTGSGGSSAGYPFALTGNATSTLTQFNGGVTAYASSTIGNGTQAGGLTVSGGATTTLDQYIAGQLRLAASGLANSGLTIKNIVIGGGGQNSLQGMAGIYVNPNSSNAEVTVENSSGVEGGLMSTSGNIYVGTWSNNALIFRANNGDRMRLSSAGGLGFGSVYSGLDPGANNVLIQGLTGIGTSSPFAKLSIQANNGDTNTVLFAIGSSTQSATTSLFLIDNQGNLTQSGPSTGSATKGTCFKAKNANANSFTFWYFPTAGAAPTYQTADCGGAGTTTITYQ